MDGKTKGTFTRIDLAQAMDIARAKHDAGWRFVEVHANRPYKDQGIEVVWTYVDEDAQVFEAYEAFVEPGTRIPSVSALFPCAFMYENEMHDLYGLPVDGITLDYRGNWYGLMMYAPMIDRDEDKPSRAAAEEAAGDARPDGADQPAADTGAAAEEE